MTKSTNHLPRRSVMPSGLFHRPPQIVVVRPGLVRTANSDRLVEVMRGNVRAPVQKLVGVDVEEEIVISRTKETPGLIGRCGTRACGIHGSRALEVC